MRPGTAEATSVLAKNRTSPRPSAWTWKKESPASAAKIARSRTSSSYSAEPEKPCAPAFAVTRAAAQRWISGLSRDIAAPAVSPSASSEMATRTTARGGRLTGPDIIIAARGLSLFAACGKVGALMRGGDAYVASLRDGRAVYLDGERVDDVTKHPAFVEPIRRIAETYDRAKAAAGEPALTFADQATGARHSNMWPPPRSAEDPRPRPRVPRVWAQPSFGPTGRTPAPGAVGPTAFPPPRRPLLRGAPR